jgi:hypothetical protein
LPVDMGLSMRVGATALASWVALSSVSNAQGFYYQDPTLQCDATYNFQDLGCAATNARPFTFVPDNWDGPTQDNSRAYINYDTGDHINSTVTPYFCAEACRAHGYKYASLWDKSCSCGGSLSYTPIGATAVVLSPGTDAASVAQCTKGTDNNDYPPCDGDRNENCGSNQGARIFVDPSFGDEATLVTGPLDYNVLGCFNNPNFPVSTQGTAGPVSSTTQCLTICADLGFPLAYMAADNPP